MPCPMPEWTLSARRALATVRIVLGLTFLWAFLDKLLGLTFSTPAAGAWLRGGHPTKGYLGSSFGPLADLFKAIAGNPLVDTLFMAGLLGVGVALTFGVAMRLGAWSGVAMVALMYASHPVPWLDPHGPHPFLDEHVLEAAVFWLLAVTPSGDTWGLGEWWRRRVPVAWLA